MRLALALLLAPLALPAAAVTCEDVSYLGKSYTACTVDPAADDLRLFHKDGDTILGSFRAIEGLPDVTALPFAMNAGMYHADRAPVGHYVENGVEVMRVIPNAGPGNFGLLPNGVFCITEDSARVIETLRYVDESPACRDATQSGPMLVIDGALHPRFLPDGTSRFLRNGVGTTDAGDRAVFVISNDAVSFHEFGSFFRDYLQLPNALYFDGKVSRLHAPALGRSDFGAQMGPIVGVVE
ncbi:MULTISPECIES: phosphodiester glycosidase family protein [unclassified Yoonia]|uniref:phosphodiester glycosidase family protein n=1 Tax=unclassified Yoonia TaxID=2629118 RepID=UPI002AFE213B|nr:MULTISPECIES: phosphodiester glycosidase family protein [unclassified Yoonia]